MRIDARIPVAFGGAVAAGDVMLQAGADWAVIHPVGCTCCAARGPAALALDRLFLDRVRGAVPWFDRVRVAGDPAAVRTAVRDDAVVSSRFRLAPEIGLDDAV